MKDEDSSLVRITFVVRDCFVCFVYFVVRIIKRETAVNHEIHEIHEKESGIGHIRFGPRLGLSQSHDHEHDRRSGYDETY